MDSRSAGMMWTTIIPFAIGFVILLLVDWGGGKKKKKRRRRHSWASNSGPLFRWMPSGCLWILVIFAAIFMLIYVPKLM